MSKRPGFECCLLEEQIIRDKKAHYRYSQTNFWLSKICLWNRPHILTIQQRQTRVKYYFQLPWHQKINSLKIMMLIILSEKRGAKNSNKKKKMDFLQLFLCQNFFNPIDLIFFQVQDLISRAWCGSGQLDWSDELSESEKLKMLKFWAENSSPWKLFECFAFD